MNDRLGPRLVWLCILFPLTVHAALEGENATKSVVAVRTTHAPVIDGSLGDDVWKAAPPDDRFRQRRPAEGQAATERTEVRILYDDDALYVAIRCHDSNPSGIVSRLTRRDREVHSDWVSIAIDTRHDHRSALVFELNAAGVQLDGQFFDDGNFSADWDAVWQGAVTIDGGGWNAEFAIPFTVLRFSSADVQQWGFQIHRLLARKNEEIVWSFISGTQQGWTSHFAHIDGLKGLRSRRAFELRPYAVARVETRTERGNPILGIPGHTAEGTPDLGGDVKIGLTSGLTLDATINPDFGQVEADEVVLNLSRFETFFPEKRPFFLEGRDVFQTPLQLFYPRRISGRIWTAAKLTGNVSDRVSIGALTALSEPGQDEDETSGLRVYDVVRARWASGGYGLGALATGRTRVEEAPDDHDAYVQAVDGFWSSASGKWRANAQVVASERVGGARETRTNGTHLDDGDVGFGASAIATRSTEHWFFELGYRSYSPQLEVNDAGFLTEFDTHVFQFFPVYGQRTPCGIFNSWAIIPVAIGSFNFDGVPTEGVLGAESEANFKNFIYVFASSHLRVPGTFDIHETLDGARFEKPAGIDWQALVKSDPRKSLVAQGSILGAREIGDDRWRSGFQLKLDWTPIPRWQIQIEPQASVEKLALRYLEDDDAGTYVFADLDSWFFSVLARTTFTVSPKLSLQGYVQLFYAAGDYHDPLEITTTGARPRILRDDLTPSASPSDPDFREADLNVNFLVRWEPIPGSTLFGVYTRGQTSEAYRLSRGPTEEVVLLKFVYFIAP
jgi:hypothetical protein